MSVLDSSACRLRAQEAERRAAEARDPDARHSWTTIAAQWRLLGEAALAQEREAEERGKR